MQNLQRCCVGRDSDSGWIFSLVIGIIIVMVILAIIVYGGALIGIYYSFKNYIKSFKENVIDSNRQIQAA